MEHSRMGTLDKGYKFVKNFLTKEELNILRDYALIFHRFNFSNFCGSEVSHNKDTWVYEDKIMEALLKNKTEKMEQETGLKLFPTYSYWRFYTRNAVLEKHSDRPSCEISVTVCLYSDGTKWPINVGGTYIDTDPGDAVIYKGVEYEHFRDEFKGDGQAQVFLHYVDQNGPYKHHKFDTRPDLGYPVSTQDINRWRT